MAISSLALTALQNLVVSVNALNKAFAAYFVAHPTLAAVSSVAGLPASGATGRVGYASDGRKVGEPAGGGTGVPVWFDGTNWRTFDNLIVSA